MTNVSSFRVKNCPLANNYIWLFVHASNGKLNANHSFLYFLLKATGSFCQQEDMKLKFLNKPVCEIQTVAFYVKQLYIFRLAIIQVIEWRIPTHKLKLLLFLLFFFSPTFLV